MGKSSVWTIEQFKKYTSGGLLAHRPKEFKQLDEMLAAYHKVTDPRRELAYLLTIWFRASTLLARRDVKARRRAGLSTLEAQVNGEIKRIHILAAQAGWRSTKTSPDLAAGSVPRTAMATHRQQPSAATARWDKIRRLVVPEGAQGNGRTKMLHQEYWLEFVDPQHRFGQMLEHFHDLWEQDDGAQDNDVPFWSWLDERRNRDEWQRQFDYIKNQGAEGDHVVYLDEDERTTYRVDVHGGGFFDACGLPFHTGNFKTKVAGPGWAMFVLSPAKDFYSASHEVGKFHHSSFLGGTPVKSAGEWMVDKGRLLALTGKSGHYKPGEVQLLHTLFVLHTRGVKLKGVAVKFNLAKNVWHDADEVLKNGGKIGPAMQPLAAPVAPGPWTPPPPAEDEDSDVDDVALAVQMVKAAPSHYTTMAPRPGYTTMAPKPV
jgi:hypothetical protein